MTFDTSIFWSQQSLILAGLQNTVIISGMSALIATGLGIMGALGQKTSFPIVRWGAKAYIQFFRNTPLLVQIYFFYKALPQFGLNFSPMECGIIALSLQSGAYMAEIFRTGLESIPKEQLEGGLSLGFSRLSTYCQIILPQALPILMPPLGNQITSIIKNSSLVAFITVPDLFFVVYSGGSAHFQYLEYFIVGITLYMSLNLIVSGFFHIIESVLPDYGVRKQPHYA